VRGDKEVMELLSQHGENTTVCLYDPQNSTEAIPMELGLNATYIATVSLSESRCKSYILEAGAITVYKPHASISELLTMSRYARGHDKIFAHISEEEIHRRISQFGPFQRYVFCTQPDRVADLYTKRKQAVGKLSGNSQWLLSVTTMEDAASEQPMGPTVSHWILRYEVKTTYLETERPYQEYTVAPSSEVAWAAVSHQIRLMDVVDKVEKLVKYNQDVASMPEASLAAARFFFEDVFFHRCGEGLEWKAKPMELRGMGPKAAQPPPSPLGSWTVFKLGPLGEESPLTLPSFDRMEVDKIYRAPKGFRFVDFVWKTDKGTLSAAQVTVAASHPNSLQAFNNWLKSIEVGIHVKINMYFIVLPCKAEQYGGTHGLSLVWTNVQKDKLKIEELLDTRLVCMAVRPPANFSRKYTDAA